MENAIERSHACKAENKVTFVASFFIKVQKMGHPAEKTLRNAVRKKRREQPGRQETLQGHVKRTLEGAFSEEKQERFSVISLTLF